MGAITVLRNSETLIDLPSDFNDQGWSLAEGQATHSACNAGQLIHQSQTLTIGQAYVVRYTIPEHTSGGLRILLGTAQGTLRTAAGTYTETITCLGHGTLAIWSDGALSLADFSIAPEQETSNARTLAFTETGNRWVGYYDLYPEGMLRFLDGFFTFKDGQLWRQNVGPRNTFFGVSYPSRVTFYVNVNPTQVKRFFGLRVQSNKVWSAPELKIAPSEGKPQGMRSRLKKGRFKNYNGDWFADFLRNLDDPRFTTELEALMQGEDLQGRILEVTLETQETGEVILYAVDVKTAPQNFTY